MYQRVKAQKVNAVTLNDKVDSSFHDNNKKLQMAKPPLVSPSSDKIQPLLLREKQTA